MNIIIIVLSVLVLSILLNAFAIVLVYRLLCDDNMSALQVTIRSMTILMISIGFTVFILPHILQSYNPPTEPIVRDIHPGAKTVPHMGPGRIR